MVKQKTLIAQCDKLISQYVRMRDKRCVVCGSTQNLQCGHLITRRSQSVRFDLRNCNAQCRGCNLLHEYRPERYTQWFINHYGTEVYNELVHKSKEIKKLTIPELQELKSTLIKMLEQQ